MCHVAQTLRAILLFGSGTLFSILFLRVSQVLQSRCCSPHPEVEVTYRLECLIALLKEWLGLSLCLCAKLMLSHCTALPLDFRTHWGEHVIQPILPG